MRKFIIGGINQGHDDINRCSSYVYTNVNNNTARNLFKYNLLSSLRLLSPREASNIQLLSSIMTLECNGMRGMVLCLSLVLQYYCWHSMIIYMLQLLLLYVIHKQQLVVYNLAKIGCIIFLISQFKQYYPVIFLCLLTLPDDSDIIKYLENVRTRKCYEMIVAVFLLFFFFVIIIIIYHIAFINK